MQTPPSFRRHPARCAPPPPRSSRWHPPLTVRASTSSNGSTPSPIPTACTRAVGTWSSTGWASSGRVPPGSSGDSPTAWRSTATDSTSTFRRRPAPSAWATRWARTRRSGVHSPTDHLRARPSPRPGRTGGAPAHPAATTPPSQPSPRLPAAQPPPVDRRTGPVRARADASARPAAGERPGRGRARRATIERRLGEWRFHPAVAFRAAAEVCATRQPPTDGGA